MNADRHPLRLASQVAGAGRNHSEADTDLIHRVPDRALGWPQY